MEIATLDAATKQLRKQVGLCAMTYLDCVFDEEGKLMQVCVDTVTECPDPWDEEILVAAQMIGA